jgi:hypothetical protein
MMKLAEEVRAHTQAHRSHLESREQPHTRTRIHTDANMKCEKKHVFRNNHKNTNALTQQEVTFAGPDGAILWVPLLELYRYDLWLSLHLPFTHPFFPPLWSLQPRGAHNLTSSHCFSACFPGDVRTPDNGPHVYGCGCARFYTCACAYMRVCVCLVAIGAPASSFVFEVMHAPILFSTRVFVCMQERTHFGPCERDKRSTHALQRSSYTYTLDQPLSFSMCVYACGDCCDFLITLHDILIELQVKRDSEMQAAWTGQREREKSKAQASQGGKVSY